MTWLSLRKLALAAALAVAVPSAALAMPCESARASPPRRVPRRPPGTTSRRASASCARSGASSAPSRTSERTSTPATPAAPARSASSSGSYASRRAGARGAPTPSATTPGADPPSALQRPLRGPCARLRAGRAVLRLTGGADRARGARRTGTCTGERARAGLHRAQSRALPFLDLPRVSLARRGRGCTPTCGCAWCATRRSPSPGAASRPSP